MKQPKKQSRTLNLIKSIINVREWIDFDRISSFALYIKTGIRKMTVPDPVIVKNKKSNFSDAVKSLNLSEAQLLTQQKGLLRLSIIMVLAAVALTIYFFYHLFHFNIWACLISLVLVSLALALAFRYHFWYFQIKEGKLGCTFTEWYNEGLLGRKTMSKKRATKEKHD